MARRVPRSVENRYIGEGVVWNVTMSPAVSVAGWTMEINVPESPPGWAGWYLAEPTVTVVTEATGVFSVTIPTTGWITGVYLIRLARTNTLPGDISELLLILRSPDVVSPVTPVAP